MLPLGAKIVLLCKNVFGATLTFCWCKNAFYAKMHFCIKCIWCCPYILLVLNIFQRKMFSCAKMLCFLLCKKQRCVHFVGALQKCIWCKNAFLQRITFDFVKCSASHFPKENVQQNKMLQMHLMPKCIQHQKTQHSHHDIVIMRVHFIK